MGSDKIFGVRQLWFCFLLVVEISLVRAQTDQPGSGVTQILAEARAANISQLRYELLLTITQLAQAPITGELTLRFQLKDRSQPLVLDFGAGADHILELSSNGQVGYAASDDHLIIPARSLRTGSNEVNVRFIAGDASLNRSADFLYALFVPARAHLALPCFDQPSLKARWTLRVRIPANANWQVVGNGADVAASSASNEATKSTDSANWTTHYFAETEPLPTYLFSFAVGDFKVETAERDGRTFRMFHRETDAAKVARNKDAIFDLHARSLAFLENYTAIPYAFGKFDFVLIPAFQFGGMEHAGEIFYNASGLMLDGSATQNQVLNRASTIAHETAHMWFGDLVTMAWFNDVWMKEVFANFMAAKIVNPSFPEVNHDLRFLLAHYPAAYEVDRTRGSNPIRQSLANLNEAGSLYSAIIYQKAPIVMRHLESLMGEDSFRDGLREYLKAHAFGNATWPDLIDVLNRRTQAAPKENSPLDSGTRMIDSKNWSHVWVEESGRPTVRTELMLSGGRIARLNFLQTAATERGLQWPQELRVTLGYRDHVEQLIVQVVDGKAEAKSAVGKDSPLYILPNGEGWAYGAFVLDHASLEYLSTSLPKISDPLTRGSALVTLWESMLDRGIPAARFVDLTLEALPRETDEQVAARELSYLRSAWWRFLSASERAGRQEQMETLLRAGLDVAPTASRKSAWFAALRDTAVSQKTLRWMQSVWSGKVAIDGLPFAEADYATLAQELAVREIPGWAEILQTQLARMKNPDRRDRFAFVIPALSADPAVREHWFQSLRDLDHRRHEPWVLDGLNYLNHPLRADASAKFIRPSLELLTEIQRTGDIFFPTRWMNAALNGYNSTAAARIVRDFVATLPPDYPPRMKATILQASDELFRAAEMPR